MEITKPVRDNAVMSATGLPIFIGYDRREDIAYHVCCHSLRTRSSVPLEITPLVQDEMRARGVYTRGIDPLASTDFTYTRFFVPFLTGYRGWALFCDCDFLWLADVAELFSMADDRYAAMCVHHDHRPTERSKMDGREQTVYPRKNWSSLVLFNCGHSANAALTRNWPTAKAENFCIVSAGWTIPSSAPCRNAGTGWRAGTTSPMMACLPQSTILAAARGSMTGKTWIMQICGSTLKASISARDNLTA